MKFISIVMFGWGLALGSFVNMLVFRTAVAYGLRKGKVKPKIQDNRSVCDYCGKQLSVWENIPVVSWLALRGKSKCCATPLPRQYPVVELGTGLIMALTIYRVGENWSPAGLIGAGAMVAWITTLMFLTSFDLKYMILPDFGTAILAGLAIVAGIAGGRDIADSLVGAGIGLGVIGGLYLATRRKGMGMGDVKLAPVLGWWLGGQMAVVGLYLAFIGGAVVGLVLLLTKKVGRKQPIPFGPFLVWGAWAAWWGQRWWREAVEWFIFK